MRMRVLELKVEPLKCGSQAAGCPSIPNQIIRFGQESIDHVLTDTLKVALWLQSTDYRSELACEWRNYRDYTLNMASG